MPTENLISPQTRRKLSVLKRTLRAHLMGRGLCLLLVAAVAAVFLTLAIDYPLRLDRAQRLLINLMALGGLGYVLWRFLLRPLRVPMGPEELALVFERHYPHLEDRLISAQQFGAAGAAGGASEALIRKVAEQANAEAPSLRPAEVVAGAGTWKRGGWLGGAAAALVLLTAWQPGIMKQWFFRNVLLANVPYPQQTYLHVEGGPEFRVVRGGDLSVTVRATGVVIPREVTFHMDFPGLGRIDRTVSAAGARGDVFVKTFEKVSDEFTFHVTGNDDRTDRFAVLVASRPELIRLEGAKHYPAYMNQPEGEPFKAGRGVISVPPGTQLVLVGAASKDLRQARLVLEDKASAEMQILNVPPADDPSGAPRPRGVQGTLSLPERIEDNRLTLRFELVDTEGIANPEGAVYILRIARDAAPRISMTRRGVRGQVTPWARIPLVLQATDDHGVAAMTVSAGIEPGKDQTTAPAPVAFPVSADDASFGRPKVDAVREIQLEKVAPKVGQLVRVRAAATDTLPASFGGPNEGLSPVQTFKVVSEDELLAELVRKQMEIRQDFAATVDHQGVVRDKLRATGDRLRAFGPDAEVTRGLNSVAAEQRRVAAECAVAAQRLEEVVEEMDCNRLLPNERRRLAERVVAPLEAICEKPMNDAIARMSRASKSKDAEMLGRFTTDEATVLDGFCARLESILSEMKELESRQQLVSQLKRIIDISDGILNKLREDLQHQTGELFDPTTRPAPASRPAREGG